MLKDRDLDEVDLILIPAVEAIAELRKYLCGLGLSDVQQIKVVGERWPQAKAILAEDAWPDTPSVARH